MDFHVWPFTLADAPLAQRWCGPIVTKEVLIESVNIEFITSKRVLVEVGDKFSKMPLKETRKSTGLLVGLCGNSGSESGSHKGGALRGSKGSGGVSGGGGGDGKPTRVRTVLNEKQLHTLRTCYAANPRPDALMKEQLVEMTGLSPRVIRVWFQNKRCKDKKKTILMKQQMQQEKVGISAKIPNEKTPCINGKVPAKAPAACPLILQHDFYKSISHCSLSAP
ncbi:hypothetical protein HUJ04_004899 [Dendroctonus ponderosae]|nr:hypothetical protein HUJ04_004899 [Dendroctonus ponderosae]